MQRLTTTSACLALLWSAASGAQDVVLRTGLWIDGHGQSSRDTIIGIEEGVIQSMDLQVPPAASQVIDLSSYTVLPGLIDCHVHITYHFDQGEARGSEAALWGAYSARSLLESGFTTVRSLGASDYADVDLRDAIAAGRIAGPRLLVSGRPLSDANAAATEGDRVAKGEPAATEAEIRDEVRARIAEEIDWLKVFATRSSRQGGTATYSRQQLDWAIDEAARAGIPVSVHAHSAEGARRAILAGASTIEHGALLDESVLDLMLERGTFYSPNLYLGEYYLAHGEEFGFSQEALDWTRKLLPPRTEVFTRAVQKGVKIVFGTDANTGWVWSGETAIELERRVAAGQSTKDAIVSATSRAAEALGLSDQTGDLKTGLQADIIAVEGNPLDDITALGHVVFVMKDGIIFKSPSSSHLP